MNGFKSFSESYKKMLKDHPELSEDLNAKIEALDFLSQASDRTIHELFNSSVFNDIVKGYAMMASDNIGLDDETRRALKNEISFLFDTVTANQAEDYYHKH